ncbi:hypothetical protein HPB47_003203 [Ixodes persulcatus]|uniref:Uncharacterized protein n=1 Tax=Ixodes persulcatus TaxID=34615 RepID=A0AC60PKQ7_IXOPE|nr:hypothetical protein HPB47_003203 [Ixodes persulcatus]
MQGLIVPRDFDTQVFSSKGFAPYLSIVLVPIPDYYLFAYLKSVPSGDEPFVLSASVSSGTLGIPHLDWSIAAPPSRGGPLWSPTNCVELVEVMDCPDLHEDERWNERTLLLLGRVSVPTLATGPYLKSEAYRVAGGTTRLHSSGVLTDGHIPPPDIFRPKAEMGRGFLEVIALARNYRSNPSRTSHHPPLASFSARVLHMAFAGSTEVKTQLCLLRPHDLRQHNLDRHDLDPPGLQRQVASFRLLSCTLGGPPTPLLEYVRKNRAGIQASSGGGGAGNIVFLGSASAPVKIVNILKKGPRFATEPLVRPPEMLGLDPRSTIQNLVAEVGRGRDLATNIDEGVKQLRVITSEMVHITMCTIPEVSGQVSTERAVQKANGTIERLSSNNRYEGTNLNREVYQKSPITPCKDRRGPTGGLGTPEWLACSDTYIHDPVARCLETGILYNVQFRASARNGRIMYAAPYMNLSKSSKGSIDATIRKSFKTALSIPQTTSNEVLKNFGIHNNFDEMVLAQREAQITRLSNTATGRTVLGIIGEAERKIEDGKTDVPRVWLNTTYSTPLPKNMNTERNQGRRRARAKALNKFQANLEHIFHADAGPYPGRPGTFVIAVHNAKQDATATTKASNIDEAEEAAVALARVQAHQLQQKIATITTDSKTAILNMCRGRVGAGRIQTTWQDVSTPGGKTHTDLGPGTLWAPG